MAIKTGFEEHKEDMEEMTGKQTVELKEEIGSVRKDIDGMKQQMAKSAKEMAESAKKLAEIAERAERQELQGLQARSRETHAKFCQGGGAETVSLGGDTSSTASSSQCSSGSLPTHVVEVREQQRNTNAKPPRRAKKTEARHLPAARTKSSRTKSSVAKHCETMKDARLKKELESQTKELPRVKDKAPNFKH